MDADAEITINISLRPQDVVYALAHATGKSGRFTLIERWRNNERQLAPTENPLKVWNVVSCERFDSFYCFVDLDEMGGIFERCSVYFAVE